MQIKRSEFLKEKTMIGIGTIINTAAVLAGGSIGLFIKKGLDDKIQTILMQTCGIVVIFLGVVGTIKGMIIVVDGIIQTHGTMLLIFSLVLGGLVGQIIDIESYLEKIGIYIKKRFNRKEDNRFVDGFVNTSLIICIGAMAIIGAIEDGLTGNYSTLAAKSVIDFVIVIIFASNYGLGVLFSAIPIFLYQGSITLLTVFAGPLLGAVLIGQLSYIGSALIFCVGINIAFGKKFNVGNMLPALLGPIIFALLGLG